MEHGHHGQDGLPRADAQHTRHAGRQGTERQRPVRIQHALGVAGGARGVAQRCAGLFITFGPRKTVMLAGHQGLVGLDPGHPLQVDGAQRVCITQRHPVPHAGARRRNGAHQRGKAGVKQHHLVVGVVDDVGQLLGVQTRVAGVHDHAAAGHGVVRLQVAVVVPGQRPHHAAGAQAQRLQCVGQLPGAPGHVGETVAVQAAIGVARDDLLIAVLVLAMFEDGRDQ
ncbi:hypothetical protein D3C71_1203430 [compost metagenome]